MSGFLLTLRCKDRPGIVAAVASRLAAHGGNVTEAQQFNDQESGQFFMRTAFTMASSLEDFAGRFCEEVRRFGLEWTLRPTRQTRKVLILVSKFDHCLADLLYRTRIGELNMEIVGVVSNHPQAGCG